MVAQNKAVPISSMPGGSPQGDWLVPAIGWDAGAGIWRPYKITINQLNAALVNKVLSGSGAPGPGVGVDGDFYIDTSVFPYDFYGPKLAGAWGNPAPAANTVRSGTGVPGAGVGNNGDFFIRTDVFPYLVYGPKTAGAWGAGQVLNNTIRTSSGVPSDAMGNDGDVCIRIDTSPYLIYGPKVAGAWGTGVVMTNTVRTGSGAPAGGLGNDGDWYIDIANPLIPTIRYKSAGTWGSAVSLQGPTGPQGAGYGGTSTTSLLIANSVTKVFTTQAGLAYQVGNYVRASSAANGANYMEGLISAYSGTSLSIDVTKIGGSGTFADWVFAPSGAPGTGDMLAANNLSDVVNKATGRANLGVAIGSDVQAYNANLTLYAAIGNWKALYTNGSGAPIALSLGAANTIFGSNGTSNAPSFQSLDAWGGVIKAGNQNLTGGFSATSASDGTKSSGTYTPDPLGGNIKHITANGAFTLAPPSSSCTIVLEVLNGASAGAITTSGFTKVTGDVYATTNALKYNFYIAKTQNYSHLHIQALQ